MVIAFSGPGLRTVIIRTRANNLLGGSGSIYSVIPLLVLLLCAVGSDAQCPGSVVAPCDCATTRYEQVSIVCDQAGSLENVLRSIGNPQTLIDSLVITNTPIKQIPGFAFQGLAIRRLVFRNNELNTIHPQAFEGQLLDTLIELEIRSNTLGEVPQSGIPMLRNLRSLVLSSNGIHNVPDNAFLTYQSRTVLRRLDLSGNRLTEIPSQAFLGLESLQQLSLDKNYLSLAPTPALKHLVTLEDLSLGVNHLETLGVGALPLPNLKSLSLEVNRIRSIPAEAFQQVPGLLYLYLSNNQFDEVDPLMFFYINQLKVLAMGNNVNVRALNSSAFQYVPGLVRLEMPDCSVTNIDNGAFQKVPKVQVIVLSRNKLSSIRRGTFDTLTELVSLDMKENDLSSIEDRSFSGLNSLKQLDLSDNRIQTLGPSTFDGTFQATKPPTARVLYLYENPWLCDDRLDWMREWLRNNRDIQITAPGYEPTKCWKPASLNGMEIRQMNPQTTPSPVQMQRVRPTLVKELNRRPVKLITKPTIEEELKNRKVAKIDEPKMNLTHNTKMTGMNMAAVILGVILGIFFVSMLLLLLVRYLVTKNRQNRKYDDEQRRFNSGGGSVVSGYNSSSFQSGYAGGGGSAYPTPPDMSPMYRSRDAQQRTGYFLNRPWYWWF